MFVVNILLKQQWTKWTKCYKTTTQDVSNFLAISRICCEKFCNAAHVHKTVKMHEAGRFVIYNKFWARENVSTIPPHPGLRGLVVIYLTVMWHTPAANATVCSPSSWQTTRGWGWGLPANVGVLCNGCRMVVVVAVVVVVVHRSTCTNQHS